MNKIKASKKCTECLERDSNPMHGSVCNVCYSNAIFGAPGTHRRTKKEEEKFENVKLVFSIVFGLFLLWMMFGGLFESKSNEDAFVIDCRQPGSSNISVCNGDHQSEMQEEDYWENVYYQNIVR